MTSMTRQPQDLSDDERLAREGADESEVTETRQALVTPPAHDAARDEEPGAATREVIHADSSTGAVREDASVAPAEDRVERDAPYLSERTSLETDERWRRIQSEFVDDPRKSVAEAHKLVSDVVQQIVDAFADERNGLERQWSKGDSVSTEDLRVCLQRYRAFFSRLVPSMKGLSTH